MALLRKILSNVICKRNFIATSALRQDDKLAVVVDDANISRAMRVYKIKAEEQKKFMSEKIMEFDIGKRHLANMMGADVETFTQEDIDEALVYLLPSGLFQKTARPNMKHPSLIFPKFEEAEFDDSGRPLHSLFYTGQSSYYQLLQEISLKAQQLDKLQWKESQMKLEKPGFRYSLDVKVLELESTMWVSKDTFTEYINKPVNDKNYEFFITSMDRLVSHPFSYREQKFIMKFRVEKKNQDIASETIPELMYTDKGIPYSAHSLWVKRCTMTAKVYGRGTGKISINGGDITFFLNHQHREQILFPLQFTGLLGLVDIEATSTYSKYAWAVPEKEKQMGPAYGIRHCIAFCLRAFVDQSMLIKMKMAGLLTHDLRLKQRKRFGRRRARKRFTWKKR